MSCAVFLSAQTGEPAYEELPEEDEDLVRPTEYLFNPIQAAEEFRVGEFYWKRGSYRAAAGRYEEATKWNPGHAEAFFKLGEAHLRLAEAAGSGAGNRSPLDPFPSLPPPEAGRAGVVEDRDSHVKAAREAFEKYLELEPKGGHSERARNQLARLERR